MTPTANQLADSLRRVAPAGVQIACAAISPDHIAGLHAQEAALVDRAVSQRRQEFATGRHLLRQVLRTDSAVLRGPSGAPLVPSTAVASLAHDRQFALVATASPARYAALGIDLERESSTLDDVELHEAVVRHDDPDVAPHAAFVMKEAAYKAWSTMGGGIVGPLDARLQISDDHFSVRFLDDEVPYCGVFTHIAGYWLALAMVETVTRT